MTRVSSSDAGADAVSAVDDDPCGAARPTRNAPNAMGAVAAAYRQTPSRSMVAINPPAVLHINGDASADGWIAAYLRAARADARIECPLRGSAFPSKRTPDMSRILIVED